MSVSLSISWSGLGLSRDVARSSITLAALTGAYASVSPTGREYARAYPNKTLFSCRSTAPELQESSFPGLTGSSRPSSPRGLPNDAATETVDGLTGSSRPSSPRARKEWIIQLGPASRHRSGGESFRYAPHFSLPLGETDAQAPVRAPIPIALSSKPPAGVRRRRTCSSRLPHKGQPHLSHRRRAMCTSPFNARVLSPTGRDGGASASEGSIPIALLKPTHRCSTPPHLFFPLAPQRPTASFAQKASNVHIPVQRARTLSHWERRTRKRQ